MSGAVDDGVGSAAFDGYFAGGIDRQDESMVGDGERVTEFADILARPRVAVRLEDDDEAAGVRLTDPLQEGGDLRRVVRIVGEHTESRAFEEHVLTAADAAPAGEWLGDEAAGDEVRDGKRQ